ncbi:BatD family protein [Uliginosibacterium sp. H1]|uniref:BatD family protein n=1 Tax=Uliginosibacterium sp. H1 TaxID=3114757 RepID=UPI002E177E03|nr:BatD family protein [Uliginosibacterium sp. H1]
MARAHLQPAGEVMPGQPVTLVVDVLTDGFFTGAPTYPALDIPGAIVTPPGDESVRLNETINGKPWFGMSHRYIITPQTGGELQVPALSITVKLGPGGTNATVRTAPLTIHVKAVERPPGAENAIGSTRIVMKQTLDRKLDGLKQGDSFTRRIEVDADGVQAMMLTPVGFPPVKGLATYPVQPVVEDILGDRSHFIGGRRVDAVTYVAQQPGDYELPAVSLQWWDLRAGQLRKAEVPALKFSVAANPGYQPAFALQAEQSGAVVAPVRHRDWHLALAVLLAVGAALFTAWWLYPWARSWWRRAQARSAGRRAAYEGSEAAAYAALMKADGDAAWSALYRWVGRLPAAPTPATLEEAARQRGDVELAHQAEALLAAHYASAAKPQGARELTAWAKKLRKASHARQHEAPALPPLNP